MDFFDTAEAYGPWTNEEMVGEAFTGMRDKVKIATKFGWDIDQDTGEHRGGVNSKPDQIRRAVEGSLKRLNTDYIDLYYQHRVDPEVPMEDVAGVGQGLIAKARCCISACRKPAPVDSPGARSAAGNGAAERIFAWTREPEDEIIPTIEELGIGLVPYSPLGKGFLTGKISVDTELDKSDIRNTIPRFDAEAREANQRLVDLFMASATTRRLAGANSPCMAAGPKAVDRAAVRYAQA